MFHPLQNVHPGMQDGSKRKIETYLKCKLNWNVSSTNDQSTNTYYISSQWDSQKEVSYYSYDYCKGMLAVNKVGQWICNKESICKPPYTLWFIGSEKNRELFIWRRRKTMKKFKILSLHSNDLTKLLLLLSRFSHVRLFSTPWTAA